jgi:two-component system chemotaxis response regulator CheY
MSESPVLYSRLLLVDDDPSIRALYSQTLSRAGFDVETARNGKEGLEVVQVFKPDLVILDLVMPEQEGIETILQLQAQHPSVPILAISGALGASEYLHVANLLGARRTLAKPIKSEQLLEAVRTIFQEARSGE